MSQQGIPVVASANRYSALRRWTHQRLFFSGFAIAAAIVVVIGFGPSYFLRPLAVSPALSPTLHLHGAAFTAWIALLIAQTNLAARGHLRLHRTLGTAGAALAVVMLVTGYAAAMEAGKRWASAGDGAAPPLGFLVIPLGGLVVFAVLFAAALWLRHRAEFHRRLMLIATIDLLNAAVDRLPGVAGSGLAPFYYGTDLFLLALVVYDLAVLRRLHPATLWGGSFLVASQLLRVKLAGTAGWLAVATWLTS
jgi:hypothetical protein